MTGRFLATILAVCALVLGVGSVGPAAAPGPVTGAAEAAAQRSNVLRFGQAAADLQTLDPHYASGTQDRSLVDMVYNALIRYKPGDGTVFEPDLATALPEPRMVNGKQEWTFTLRQGVMCHEMEGVPSYELTSEDVVYSLQKSADRNRSAYSGDYTGMTVEAVDTYTVKVTLDQPISMALFYPKVANYAGGFILCKRAAEALGTDGLKTRAVGTGPFKFSRYIPNDRVELVANEKYFRGRPQLDGVEFRYIADLSSRELGLRGGQLDVINGTQDITWVDQMARNPNTKVDIFGVGEVTVVHFNMAKPPLDNLKVRQALAYALDREEFVALVGEKVGEAVYSPVPAQFLPGGLTKQEAEAKGVAYNYDPNKAKQLLAEAGYPDGFSLSVVTSELPSYRTVYESMQAQLAKVGVKLDVQVVDHATMHSRIREDINPIVVYVAWRPNADVVLTQFFHSDSIVVTGPKANTNFSHYNGIDRLIEQARTEQDASRQAALWQEAQVKLLEDMAGKPIMFTNQVYARSSNVDYGHELKSVLALYPGITEQTRLTR